jgi:hypothetical protein
MSKSKHLFNLYSRKKQVPISLTDMLRYGAAFKHEPRLALNVLHEELCVRCCHQANAFRVLDSQTRNQTRPVSRESPLANLAAMYEQQFYDLRKWSLPWPHFTSGSSSTRSDSDYVMEAASVLTHHLTGLQSRQSKVTAISAPISCRVC